MSNQNSNTDQSVIEIIDKPNLITVLVGGITMAIILYFILGKIFDKWEYIIYLQISLASIILVISYLAGNQVDGIIKINSVNGWVYAKNKEQFWEGYCSELTQFEVLQKDEEDHTGTMITKFMIYLEFSDQTNYRIELKLNEVKGVIKAVEDAKNSIKVSS